MADRKTLRLTAGVLMASALAAVLGCGAAGIAIAEDKKAETAAPNAVEGGRTFTRYCALCHGLDGAGLGPLADLCKRRHPI